MARKELVIAIKAIDQISAPIRQTMTAIGRLGRRAIDTSARVLRSMGGLAKSLLNVRTLFATIATAFAGGAIVRSLAGVAAELDRTAKAARALGIAVEEYSKLEFVADRAGISTDQLATAFRTAQRNVAQFVRGEGGQAARAFRDLDVTLTDANGRILEGTDLLKAILVPISQIPDEAVRTQKLVDVFGRAGAQMKNLGQDFEGVLDQAVRLGFVTENQARIAEAFQDSITNLRRGWLIFKANVLEAIGPVLEDMVNRSAENLSRFGKMVGDFLLTVRAAFGDGKLAAQARVALLQIYDNVLDVGRALIESGARVLGVVLFGATKAAIDGISKMIKTDLGRELVLGVTGAVVELDDAMDKLGAARGVVFRGLSPVVTGARALLEDLSREAVSSGATMADVAGTVAGRVAVIMPAVNAEFARTRDRLLELAPQFDKTGELVRAIADSMRQLGIETEAAGGKVEEAGFKFADIWPSISQGFKNARDEAAATALQFVQLGEDIFNTVGNRISGGLGDLATGAAKAKDAFRDMAKGILDDLTRLIIRMAVFNALSAAFGGGRQIGAANLNNAPAGGFQSVGTGFDTAFARTGGVIRPGGHVRRFFAGGVVPGPNINRDMVPVLAAPGEGFVNRRGMRSLGAEGLASINRGEGAGGGVTVHMVNHFHGGFTQSMAAQAAGTLEAAILKAINNKPAFRDQLRARLT
ncbi:MAG: hypothetical protein RIB58_06100 [Phycisphaerales bacterium]